MVDINCDMGEGMANDALLMPFISSANIACGYHAGDKATMQQTIGLCLTHGVAVGAHPSFPDRENFGRTEMEMSPDEAARHVLLQLEFFKQACGEQDASMHHVKLHGALYNMAARQQELAAAIAKVIFIFNDQLVLYGLSGSFIITEGIKAGLKTASEVFADRSYQPDGTLTPRSMPGALIDSPEAAAKQALQMVQFKKVTTTSGSDLNIKADTICIHGDGAHAVEIATLLYQQLAAHGISIGSLRGRNDRSNL